MHSFTADICDKYREKVQVLAPDFINYGGVNSIHGKIVTLKLDRDNAGLIKLLDKNGDGRVIVVDVNREYYAVVGENLMRKAFKNGWAGIIINGYVRDTHITPITPIGLWAIGKSPRRSFEKSSFEIGVELNFGGVKFRDGDYLFGDLDGIVVIPSDIAKEVME
jgi:regulator of ribonuclease activity A